MEKKEISAEKTPFRVINKHLPHSEETAAQIRREILWQLDRIFKNGR